jgi:peptide-methionine (S)-S-oxide reductase
MNGATLLRGLFVLVLALAAPLPTRAQSLEPPPPAGLKTAAFAGGCFWCMVHPFEELPGVSAVVSGYTGGTVASPTYHQVSAGDTGHRESVQVTYDPKRVGYDRLLHVYWRNIDPFDAGGQFCDRGSQYTSAIFVADDEQRRLAEASKRDVEKRFGRPVATVVLAVGPFYRAEEYHQEYYKKNPIRYRYYRLGCGRDARLEQVWGKEAGGQEQAAAQ